MRIDHTVLGDGPLYVAVSCGTDSVAAAHWLRFHFRRDFAILHVDHGTCKFYNDGCRAKVAKLARLLGVTAGIYRTKSPPNATEAELRELRLEGFRLMANKNATIITAHHLDDVVESYMMNCLRGNPKALPMPTRTSFGDFAIAHPFAYSATKEEFERYVQENNLWDCVQPDPSNYGNGPLRNFLRNVVIPEINGRDDLSLASVVRRLFC